MSSLFKADPCDVVKVVCFPTGGAQERTEKKCGGGGV